MEFDSVELKFGSCPGAAAIGFDDFLNVCLRYRVGYFATWRDEAGRG